MATASLLEAIAFHGDPLRSRPPSLGWNPLLSQRIPYRLHGSRTRSSKTVGFIIPHSAWKLESMQRSNCVSSEEEGNPLGRIVRTVIETLKALKKPAVAALLVGVLLAADPLAAMAASGGRMGGRSFSSSSSAPSYSRSYSAPSGSSFSFSAPFYAPSLFGASGGFYVGPAVGVGFGAGSGFFLLMMGFAAFVLLSGFLSDRSEDGSVLTAVQKTSVLKLQLFTCSATPCSSSASKGTSATVGLLGLARSFQQDLDRIAETADTSTSEGLNYVLAETALALLRHPDCCISAYSSVDVKRTVEDGEKRFNQLSIEERGKFDEETLVNVNNIKRQRKSGYSSKTFSNEYIVITILVAAEGVHKLPVINSSTDLKEALQKLGSIPASKTLAVEVLWTPQNENDTLSERELLEDYPLLRPL
ncbi:hypothetical protein AXF42_Ash014238 [Apostasia shenzhenica]|uniref:Myelin-associated oligodendrocyte basic protein n=1 Tax=Apostasia shenzhenica TaxID=1088818 RepID=A0A2I0A1D0_9ASPA|nr:hypothetical protein AXF42_Ash014238 [Apostasia shenzhenica]